MRHSPRKPSGSGTPSPRPPPRRKVSAQAKRPVRDADTSLISDFLDDFYAPDSQPDNRNWQTTDLQTNNGLLAPPPMSTTRSARRHETQNEKPLPTTPLPKRYSELCAAISATISPRTLTNMDRAGRSARASRTRSTALTRTEMRLLANERASTDAGVPTYLRELLIRAKERRPFTHYTSLAHAIPISPDDRAQTAVDATVFFLATLPGKKADLFAIEDFIRIKCPNLRTVEVHEALHDANCIKLAEYCMDDSGNRLVQSQVCVSTYLL